MPYLLPFLEQNNIYTQIPAAYFTGKDGVWWGVAWGAANNWIKTFQCPPDDLAVVVADGEWAYLFYSGYTLYGGYFGGNYPTLGCTNYIGCAGSLGDVSSTGDSYYGQWTGLYADGYGIRLVAISDGTSNTIAFGETLGGTDSGQRDFKFPWMGASGAPLAWALIEPTGWYSFGSKHTGVVNFAFCDGSVHAIPKGVGAQGANTNWFAPDWIALQQAGGYKDGQVVNWSLLGQ